MERTQENKMKAINHYLNTTATKNAFITYEEEGNIYGAEIILNADNLDKLTLWDTPSEPRKGGEWCLKYRFSKARAEFLKSIAYNTVFICATDLLEWEFKHSKYNRGEIAERLIAEQLGAIQNKSKNLDYNKGGDITLNGITYQVKHNKAQITNANHYNNVVMA